MQTAEIVETKNGQTVRLPDEFRFAVASVAIRREGDAVILAPIKPAQWPTGFFDNIHIDDLAFTRLPQGTTPPAPTLG